MTTENKQTHTPAWANARGTDESGNLLHAVGGDGWPENAVERSNLIAAAPIMLKALLGCIHHDNALVESHKIPASLRRQIEAALSDAQAGQA